MLYNSLRTPRSKTKGFRNHRSRPTKSPGTHRPSGHSSQADAPAEKMWSDAWHPTSPASWKRLRKNGNCGRPPEPPPPAFDHAHQFPHHAVQRVRLGGKLLLCRRRVRLRHLIICATAVFTGSTPCAYSFVAEVISPIRRSTEFKPSSISLKLASRVFAISEPLRTISIVVEINYVVSRVAW